MPGLLALTTIQVATYGSEHAEIAGKASLSKFMHAVIFCPFAGHTELWNIV
ncbi:MAG: hypothetical protein ROZ00_10430 [Denitratisoma sp.]|nr:hypothetical protein [Denitratisoma sp.]